MFYIGIDVGTTCCKCVLFDCDGSVKYVFNEEMPINHFGDKAEQSAEMWLNTVIRGLKDITSNNPDCEIKSLSISTQGISFVITDENFVPLCDAVSWLDSRARAEHEKILSHFSAEDIEKTCGVYPSDCYVFPKLLWIKSNRKQLLNRENKIMTALDFLNAHLTGKAVIDYTMAGGTMLLNIEKKCWEEKFLDYLGLSEKQFSQLADMGTFVGKLLPEICEKTGLDENVEVFLGGQDQKLAAIGGGIGENVITVSLGTSTAVSILNKRPKREFKKFIFRGNDYIYEAALSTTGASIRWLKQVLGLDSYAEMDALAEIVGKSEGLVFNTDFIGGADLKGLKLSHGKGNIVYALYEGIAEQIKNEIDNTDKKYRVRLFGGGAKSGILCEIIKKTLNREVTVSKNVETAALGAAMLAAGGRFNAE